MPRPAIPVVQAVAAEPRRALNPDVAVVALCLVLYARGFFSFLALFGAVLVLDDHSSLFLLSKSAFAAVITVCDWTVSILHGILSARR